jgi:hypothetical protein
LNAGASIEQQWATKTTSMFLQIFKNPIKQELVGIDKELFDLVHVNRIQELLSCGACVHVSRSLFVAAEKDTSDNYALRALLQNSTDDDINGQNEVGNTTLHQAALAVGNHNIELLIAAGASTTKINSAGLNPLQSLQATLQGYDDIAGAFYRNSPPNDIKMVSKLDCITSLMTSAKRELLREGWMSRRMHRVLLIEAEIDSDGCLDKALNRMEYIPDSVTERKSSDFYRGWTSVWRAACKVLQAGLAPTVNRIRIQIERSGSADHNYRAFLRKGGRIEYAIDAIITVAKNVCVNGDDGWEYEDFQESIEKYFTTPLDHAIDVAWFKCNSQGGGESLKIRGPHRGCCDDEFGKNSDDELFGNSDY